VSKIKPPTLVEKVNAKEIRNALLPLPGTKLLTQMLFHEGAFVDSSFKAFEIGGVQLCLS
jgi:hypothetical protein